MRASSLTRRSLLRSGAGMLAAGLLAPERALSALTDPAAPELEQLRIGRLEGGQPRTIELEHPADLLGVQWASPFDGKIELRFLEASGTWSRWVSAASHGHRPDMPTLKEQTVGDPIWTGGTTQLQISCRQTVNGVRLHLIDVSGGIGAHTLANRAAIANLDSNLPQATPLLQTGPGQPAIIARRAWAADVCHPKVAPEYGRVQLAFVHHTDSPNSYLQDEVAAMLRAIFIYHRYVNGWNDIGYNFVIDRFGDIFEARAGGIDEAVIGAQAGGYNAYSTGIAMLGTYSTQRISHPAHRSLANLLAWKLSLHGAPVEGHVTVRVTREGAPYSRFPAGTHVSLPRVAGHRDGDSTECPGNTLYRQLPALRQQALTLAGHPAQLSMSFSQVLDQAESQAAMLTGGLEFLDGTPIPGAPIEIQAREVRRKGELISERGLTQTTSDADGQWSVTLYPPSPGAPALLPGTWLRALCPGTSDLPATISPPLALPAELTLTAPEPSTVAPPVS